MARLQMSESVSGWYNYEMDINEEYCGALNTYLCGVIDDFIPLTINDVIDLCVYNKDNSRCLEKVCVKEYDSYTQKTDTYFTYLRNEVIDYVKQDCFNYPVGDFECCDGGDLYFERG